MSLQVAAPLHEPHALREPEPVRIAYAPPLDPFGLDQGPSPHIPAAPLDGTDAIARALRHLDLAPADIAAACLRADRLGTDAATELLAQGVVDAGALAEAMARALQLPLDGPGDDDVIVGEHRLGSGPSAARLVATCSRGFRRKLFILPTLESLPLVAGHLAAAPRLRSLARVAAVGALLTREEAHDLGERAERARLSLAASDPEASARTVVTGHQGLCAGLLISALVACAVTWPGLWVSLHAATSLVFFGCVLLRWAALIDPGVERPSCPEASERPLFPVYSILVPLRDEAHMVMPLVEALNTLSWPRSRREILLVCEADDRATVAAAQRASEGHHGVRVIQVPPSEPRTKPKALNFALPLVRGDFVVLYDAEDRPHPDQLLQAWQRFRSADAGLACLQAPLVIGNGASNWITGLFALEYAALFRGLLPWLARHRLPLPLGGTSNHFRREALVSVGGWDSHNVTEDADLGMRLHRRGYRTGTIDCPTLEDAPTSRRVWFPQRMRWMKGWMQTWLVHMRSPLRLLRDLGPAGFAVFQLLFLGMLVAGAAHLFFALAVAWATIDILRHGAPGLILSLLYALDIWNVVGGTLGFALLAWRSLEPQERPLARRLIWMHAYWLLTSCATLRALWQLVRAPHRWEKTPHTPVVTDWRPATSPAAPVATAR